MRINRIVLRDFLSYDELDIDLTDLHTVAIVGEVGAGKSALFEAVTWGLWGKANRVVVIRDEPVQMDECMVQIDFTAREDQCTVIRTMHISGRDSSLAFIVNGVNNPSHIKAETQAAINRKIGLDFESMVAGPLMVQLHSSHLMEVDPKDRKELLIKLFGVDRYEAYHKDASARAAGYTREAERYAADLATLAATVADRDEVAAAVAAARYDLLLAVQEREKSNGELTAARERQVALREQASHAQTLRDTVDMLAGRIKDDQKEHSRVLRGISEAHQMVGTPEPVFEALPDVSAEAIQAAKGKYQTALEQANQRRLVEATIPLTEEKLERSRKLAAIVDTVPCGGQGIYATCRFLTSAPKAGEIERQEAELVAMKGSIVGLADGAALTTYRTAHEVLVEEQQSVQQEAIRREGVRQQWTLRVDAARQLVRTGKDNLARLEAQIARDQSVLERSRQQLAEVQSDATVVESVDIQVKSLKEQTDEQTKTIDMVYQPAVARSEARLALIEEAAQARPALEKQHKEATGKAEVYALLAKAFHRDGIPTNILENGIPLIESYANEILARLPDKYSLRVLTQRETKKGGMADKVDVVVERSGGRPRHYANLSGGQKFRVDFALRIALGRVLAHRSGATIDTLMLDEGWGTQDKKGIDALLESLAAVQDQFGLVLIITHHEAVIEEFEVRIEVALSEEKISSLTLAA